MRRVVCAVDCGTVVNPDMVRAQIQSAIVFGITAALRGEITLKDGRVQQTNFDTYQMLRMAACRRCRKGGSGIPGRLRVRSKEYVPTRAALVPRKSRNTGLIEAREAKSFRAEWTK